MLAEHEKIQKLNLPEEAEEKLLLRATNGLSFFNTSKMDLSKLGESGIKDNLESYIQGFSKDGRQIFEHFNFAEFIGQLNDANLLYNPHGCNHGTGSAWFMLYLIDIYIVFLIIL